MIPEKIKHPKAVNDNKKHGFEKKNFKAIGAVVILVAAYVLYNLIFKA